MSGSGNESGIINGTTFVPKDHYIYTKPKVNDRGGKSIGVINSKTMKGLYINTPLMLTWGVNENVDEKTGAKTYDMALQFPKEEYSNEKTQAFLNNLKDFESKIKDDAIKNSKDWFNKAKMSSEVVDAVWTPMLKYPKDQTTKEFDFDRPPTLRVKLNTWDGVFKCELYDMEEVQIFPNETGKLPTDLIMKATNVATVIQCGGLWFAGGKFGVTWRLIQAVVKPKESLIGKCLINLSTEEKEVLRNTVTNDDDDSEDLQKTLNNSVDDSQDEDEDEDDDDDDDDADDDNVVLTTKTPVEPKEVVKEVQAELAESAPKKKPPVRRKKTAE